MPMRYGRIVESGEAECICEPRGRGGLEGYQMGQKYKFLCVVDGKIKWYRVRPTESRYYETCGVAL